MGGFGSGGWNATGRATTAEALRLDVNQVNRAGALKPGWRGGWQWHLAGDQKSSIGLEARLGEVILRFRVTTGGADPEAGLEEVFGARVQRILKRGGAGGVVAHVGSPDKSGVRHREPEVAHLNDGFFEILRSHLRGKYREYGKCQEVGLQGGGEKGLKSIV